MMQQVEHSETYKQTCNFGAQYAHAKTTVGQLHTLANVLMVDLHEPVSDSLTDCFATEGIASFYTSSEAAMYFIRKNAPDAVLLGIDTSKTDGFRLLAQIKEHDKSIPVVLITTEENTLNAVRAMRDGAFDYFVWNFNNQDAVATVLRGLAESKAKRQMHRVLASLVDTESLMETMGHSAAVQDVQNHVNRVGPTNFSVLITGESGSGKELVTQAIHKCSHRSNKPFVALDCGSIPETLIESELFGHEKGSFTGAHQSKAGAFELAAGGTIFLDEIGNLPLTMQAKLLRVLETRRIHRIGSAQEVRVDFRVLAATNANLQDMVEKQTFRGDLYHRLSEYTISIPALRERKEDLVFLVNRFLAQTNMELCKQVGGLDDAAWNLILAYDWPGNARELRNQLRRAVLLCDAFDELITPKHLCMVNRTQTGNPERCGNFVNYRDDRTNGGMKSACRICETAAEMLKEGTTFSLKSITANVISQVERSILIKVLEMAHCNKAHAARMLHIDNKTLYKKMKEYSISSGLTVS